ncbi:hypothetical protein APHMUC_0631 [Anaplasma phagocytophilum str. ApMUC09]|uniref:Uncharacterized protein n=1 Tax=Anaplasma phagocytophilum str. ApMUC09 TaxID=1359152 RepID=A0A0F3NBF1_ANAPH|nr:hypothetical protein APHMUC_0631 [Anaplasma phagocytophilum str. ApMUC09]
MLCRVEAFNVELCPVLRLGAITTAINLAIALVVKYHKLDW